MANELNRHKDGKLWIHVELIPSWYDRIINDDLDNYNLRHEYLEVLRTYGGVKGNTVSRDILVTEDLPLYALNYLLQRAFGFLNCHLHKFNLPEEEVLRLTDSKKEKWEKLVGTLFRSPLMSEEDIFWADDYKEGSIKNWLRSKYTDPQPSKAYGESYVSCQRDIKELKEGRFRQHYEPASYEMLPRLFELDPFSLLERLSIGDVFEIASEFHYTYDFGDDWTFRITSPGPVEQCVSQGLLTENKFLKCVEKMEKTHRPVMLAHDGVMLIEDVGGINGFCDFLELSHSDPPDDESAMALFWASGQEWKENFGSDINWL